MKSQWSRHANKQAKVRHCCAVCALHSTGAIMLAARARSLAHSLAQEFHGLVIKECNSLNRDKREINGRERVLRARVEDK